MLLELFSEPCVYLLFAGVLMKIKLKKHGQV